MLNSYEVGLLVGVGKAMLVATEQGRCSVRGGGESVRMGCIERKERFLPVGTFNWPLRISSMDGQQARDIEATVDTGASFTTLPSILLWELDIEATSKRRFLVADGRRVEMDYGQAWATIDGESVVTIVVFGEDDAPPLLGAHTLEGLALAVDPEAQRLVPTHMILY